MRVNFTFNTQHNAEYKAPYGVTHHCSSPLLVIKPTLATYYVNLFTNAVKQPLRLYQVMNTVTYSLITHRYLLVKFSLTNTFIL